MPSKANIADFPSRGEFGLLWQLGAVVRPLVLPAFSSWNAPFAAWADWGEDLAQSSPRLGSIGIGRARLDSHGNVIFRAGDVLVDRSTVLGNPFPIDSSVGASRSIVCNACAEVFINHRSVDGVSTQAPSGARLPISSALAGPVAHQARWKAVDALAMRVAGGECIRLLCWCAPRRCHALSVAASVRRRAREVLAERG